MKLVKLKKTRVESTLHRTKSHVSVMFNMHKKWSGSVVYAATETRENVTEPVTETQVIRRVSRTVEHVSATFPFTDSCNFVL